MARGQTTNNSNGAQHSGGYPWQPGNKRWPSDLERSQLKGHAASQFGLVTMLLLRAGEDCVKVGLGLGNSSRCPPTRNIGCVFYPQHATFPCSAWPFFRKPLSQVLLLLLLIMWHKHQSGGVAFCTSELCVQVNTCQRNQLTLMWLASSPTEKRESALRTKCAPCVFSFMAI